MVIPPPKNAVTRPQSARDPTVRDRHIAEIRSNGPHGLASGHRVQPAQPDRNADRPVEERHRPQTQIPQLLQADHGDPGRPESPEHNDRTRTACVRTYRLTLPLGKGRIPSPPRSMQQRLVERIDKRLNKLVGFFVCLSQLIDLRDGMHDRCVVFSAKRSTDLGQRGTCELLAEIHTDLPR